MGPLKIVDFTPGIECSLHLGEFVEVLKGKDFVGKSAVETFVLAPFCG